jgi:hypothetical protein
MGKLRVDISMSLDGFVAGPNQSLDHPLGEGGQRLHDWAFAVESWRRRHGLSGGETNPDSDVVEETLRNTGASVMGRRDVQRRGGPGLGPLSLRRGCAADRRWPGRRPRGGRAGGCGAGAGWAARP